MAINFLNSVNLNQNELIKARVENQPNNTAAGTGVEGQLYYDTTLDILKIWANGAWTEVGGGVLSVSTNNSTFVNLTNVGTAVNPSLTASLSATGTPDATKYLRGDNTWSAISGIYDWNFEGDTGTPENVVSGETVKFVGGTLIGTAASINNTLTINHDSVSRSDSTSSASPAFGGTFTVVDSVTSTAQGHITSLNLKTVTLPTPTPSTITLTGEVTGSGTTSISTTVANNVLDIDNFTLATIVTASEGIANNNNDTTLPTSAAVKAYVDSSVAGGLVYQGGYNAATNTPNLDSPPTIAGIKKGWTYTVTADGTFFTEQVRIGDVLIAEIDAPTTLADWTTVQNNIDLASLTQVGIGNVNASTGIDVTYSNGTATVTNTDRGSQQNIFKNIAVSGQSTVVADTNNDTLTLAAGNGISIITADLTDTITISASEVGRSFTNTNPTTSATYTINSATHGLGTDSSVIMVQLVQVSTGETIFSDVTRGASGLITITFSTSQAAGSIRALLQKIG
jgi:hypothetical protein